MNSINNPFKQISKLWIILEHRIQSVVKCNVDLMLSYIPLRCYILAVMFPVGILCRRRITRSLLL